MRIINGHDYYDIGLAGGHDDAIRFERTPDRRMASSDLPESLHTLTKELHLSVSRRTHPNRRLTLDTHSRLFGDVMLNLDWLKVVFCGKLYSGVGLRIDQEPLMVHWTEASFVQALNGRGLVINEVTETAHWHKQTLSEYFTQTLPDAGCRWLMETGITVMIYQPLVQPRDPLPWAIDSDGLKGVQFYKIVDAYTAFQEIAMWIGGILADHAVPAVEITDDRVKAHKHGFDKHSFRKSSRAATEK